MSDDIIVTLSEDVVNVTVTDNATLNLIVQDGDVLPVTVLEGGAGGGSAGLAGKSGLVAGASFSGSPKKYAVVFGTAYDDTNYSIAVLSTDGRGFTYESKTAAGFTINANANTAIAGEVSWITMPVGEA